MTLEEIQELAEKDLQINDSELDLESIKIPQLHSKYLKLYTKFKLLLDRSREDFKLLKREKWEYFTGKADSEVYEKKPFNLKILRNDVDRYIDSDEEIRRLSLKIKYQETIVDYLDRTLKNIMNRGFQIKAASDWKKFTSGAI